jgi:peptidoglycan/LPS O-acetylase OafA/YrhL
MGTLRLFLAFAVIISHTRPLYGFVGIGGSPAVMAFFIISGFYMHLVMDSAYKGKPGLFYTNRALRLFPAYWTTLLIMLLLAASGTSRFDGGYSRQTVHRILDGSALAWLSFVPNLLIAGADFFHELGASPKTGELLIHTKNLTDSAAITGADVYLFTPQIWSVANEIVFYALVPFFVRLNQLCGSLLIVVAYVAWKISGRADLTWLHLVPYYNLIFFLFGMAAYRVYPAIKTLPTAVLLVLSAIPFVYFLTNGALGVLTPPWVWIPFAAGVPALFEISKSNRYDRFIGDLSYPVYLVHFMFAQGGRGSRFVGAESLALAAGMQIFLERPIDRLRHGRTAKLILQRIAASSSSHAAAISGSAPK